MMARRRVPNGPDYEQEAERQWFWIEEQLRDSVYALLFYTHNLLFRADYLFVVGHYSIFSIASSGNTQCLLDKLDPLLRKYQVSAYLSGHENNLQVTFLDLITIFIVFPS
jgi:tartrate-resistant acid phosphatase type 5